MGQNVTGDLINDLGRWMYDACLRVLRWTRWLVLGMGVALSGIGVWVILCRSSLGWLSLLGGVMIVFLNLSTWRLVEKFTRLGKTHSSRDHGDCSATTRLLVSPAGGAVPRRPVGAGRT